MDDMQAIQDKEEFEAGLLELRNELIEEIDKEEDIYKLRTLRWALKSISKMLNVIIKYIGAKIDERAPRVK